MRVHETVKLQQVRCVIAAARSGSFRRAAAALNVQQSSISRSVREIEDRLGAALFQRSAQGVSLTSAGVAFLEDAEAALDHLGRATQTLEAAGRDARDTLRIGAVPIPGSGPLPEALHALVTCSPACRILLHEASSADNLFGLRFGALDLAVVLTAPRLAPGVEVVSVWRELLFCAFPLGERLPSAAALSWSDIGADSLILPPGELGDLIAARLSAVYGGAFSGAVCRAGADTALRLTAARQGRAIVSAGAIGGVPPGVRLCPMIDGGVVVSAVRLVRNEKPVLRRLMALFRRMGSPASAPSVQSPGVAGVPSG